MLAHDLLAEEAEMILKDLHIDGFGVWSDLELDGADAGLTLLYGENETGKTTFRSNSCVPCLVRFFR